MSVIPSSFIKGIGVERTSRQNAEGGGEVPSAPLQMIKYESNYSDSFRQVYQVYFAALVRHVHADCTGLLLQPTAHLPHAKFRDAPR